ncbi:hypothetical protein CPB84DRAFT_1793593 [Gymnopilus junonius]|uniref:Uncharacterized protein n=1 Tax=Gymnopilus junonius TaxID=109634 RepID=A0A9P5NAU7_GYMJU|nr:hypothetical protein CPB84DRAFT_1793593 [Gymnopilus junonius]
MLLLLGAIYFLQPYILAAPTLSAASDPSLLSSPSICTCPNERSIWEIIWSCLVTIFVCSWVAIHPNIAPPKANWWRVNLRKLEYMTWTIIAPELIILWAARQWYGARKIAQKYGDRGWTKVHGHFLQMGGFMLFEGNKAQRVLSHSLLDKLLQQGRIQFPEITEEEIQDRSKNSGLSKLLVIVQTSWFVLQIITRKIEGLAITELELATAGFASLNFLIYLFWWDKPIDVSVPVPAFLMESENESDNSYDLWRSNTSDSGSLSSGLSSDEEDNLDLMVELLYLPLHIICLPRSLFLFMKRRLHQITRTEESKEMKDTSVNHEFLAVPMFYSIRIQSDKYVELEAFLVCLTGIIFGGIHCVGWFLSFPSLVELWIWRIGALVIVAFPMVLLLSIQIFPTLENNCFDSKIIRQISNGVSAILAFVGLPLYVVARVTLLVEAFVALRHLPDAAYATVKWTSLLPHI